jgi:hypothetical protein
MAEPSEIPAELRSAALRIDPRIRRNMSEIELRIRAEEIFRLLAEAETTGNDRLRIRVGKLAKSMSPRALQVACDALEGELREARLNRDDRRARDIQLRLDQLLRDNPQPDPERAVSIIAGELDQHLKVPPPVRSRLFSRRTRERGTKCRPRPAP